MAAEDCDENAAGAAPARRESDGNPSLSNGTGSGETTGGGEASPATSGDVNGRDIRRLGVGVLVLNLGDVSMQAGKFYADVQVFITFYLIKCRISHILPQNVSHLPHFTS